MFSVKSMCCNFKEEIWQRIQAKKIKEKSVGAKIRETVSPKDAKLCCYFIPYVKGKVHEIIYIVSVKINYIFGYSVFKFSKERGQK